MKNKDKIPKRNSKRTKSQKNYTSQFLNKPVYQGENNIPTSIQLIQFNTEKADVRDVSDLVDLKREIKDDMINWFKVTGISDAARITQICKDFRLHTFDLKDLLSEQRVMKVVVYDDVTFILMPGFYFSGEDLLNTRIGFILGDNFVISFKEAPVPIFDSVEEAIENRGGQIRQRGTDYLLYILLNAVNSLNQNASMKIEDELSDIEDKLIERDNSIDILRLLRARRLDYTQMKRFVLSFREEYNNLLHNTNGLIDEEDMLYFNDYDDRLRTMLDGLESLHEDLFSLLDLYYNNTNLKMNDIMKRLTVVSTIFIPLTFMAGVWGMNFKFMPELESSHGYLFAWIIFALIGLTAFFLLKKKKWF